MAVLKIQLFTQRMQSIQNAKAAKIIESTICVPNTWDRGLCEKGFL